MALFFLLWILCPFIGIAIGATKGRATEGFFLGLLLGEFGLLLIALLNTTPAAQARRDAEVANATQTLNGAKPLRQCPWCAEQIQPAARLCRYCSRDVEPTASLDVDSPNTSPSA